jgi:hypothetical protein
LESLQMEICNAIQDFEISDIPFMIDDWVGKVKNNFTLDMTQYRKDHNLSYDVKSSCKSTIIWESFSLWWYDKLRQQKPQKEKFATRKSLINTTAMFEE